MIEESPLLEALEIMPPGPDLASLLDTVDTDTCPAELLPYVIQAIQRQTAHDQARMMAGMVAMVDRFGEDLYQKPDTYGKFEPDDLATCEIACALHWTDNTTSAQVGTAIACIKRLPSLHQAMLAGE